jgi:hypothetical protein
MYLHFPICLYGVVLNTRDSLPLLQLLTSYFVKDFFYSFIPYSLFIRPPLWSSGQSSWLQIQRPGVRFSSLSDFLRSSGSGTGSTQPREYK